MWAGVGVTAEVASNWPPEPSACTAKYWSWLGSTIAVSKPDFGTVPSGASVLEVGPPRTCQAATSVAPFQLAYSERAPLEAALIASAGAVGGCAFQVNR